ncbi:MAG: hypothetical protein ACFB9M_14405 [Myxococcota bacterium]
MTPLSEGVERFAQLAWLRRQRALGEDERIEIEGLVRTLSARLEGFHPPGHGARMRPSASVRHQVEARRSGSIATSPPAEGKPEVDPFEDETDPLAPTPSVSMAPVTDLSEVPAGEAGAVVSPSAPPSPSAPQDGGAMPCRRVQVKTEGGLETLDIPRSDYTPPTDRVFMEDYYSADLEVDETGELPHRLVNVQGQPVPADDAQLWMLRATESSRTADSARAEVRAPAVPSADVPVPSVDASDKHESQSRVPERRTAQVIVHLRAGGVIRGQAAWPPIDAIDVESAHGPRRVPKHEVLAAFATGVGVPREPGRLISVTLTNDRQLNGRSFDYREGVSAFILCPEPRRGNVDQVWIPDHAVKQVGTDEPTTKSPIE